jgi:hypothetical protein
MDQPGDRPECKGLLDQGTDGAARGDIDHGRGHVEPGIAQRLSRGVGVLLAKVGEEDMLAGTYAAGDRLADQAGPDHDDDFVVHQSCTC